MHVADACRWCWQNKVIIELVFSSIFLCFRVVSWKNLGLGLSIFVSFRGNCLWFIRNENLCERGMTERTQNRWHLYRCRCTLHFTEHNRVELNSPKMYFRLRRDSCVRIRWPCPLLNLSKLMTTLCWKCFCAVFELNKFVELNKSRVKTPKPIF